MCDLLREVDNVASVSQVQRCLEKFANEYPNMLQSDRDVLVHRLARLVDKFVYETDYKAYMEQALLHHVLMKDPIDALLNISYIMNQLNHLGMDDFGINRILSDAKCQVYQEQSSRCCMTYDVALKVQNAISVAYENDVIRLEFAPIEYYLSQIHSLCYDVMCMVWARERIRHILKTDLRAGNIQTCLDFLAILDGRKDDDNDK